jgi:hypothetical protein
MSWVYPKKLQEIRIATRPKPCHVDLVYIDLFGGLEQY